MTTSGGGWTLDYSVKAANKNEVESSSPDLAITNVGTQDTNGSRLLNHVRSQGSDIAANIANHFDDYEWLIRWHDGWLIVPLGFNRCDQSYSKGHRFGIGVLCCRSLLVARMISSVALPLRSPKLYAGSDLALAAQDDTFQSSLGANTFFRVGRDLLRHPTCLQATMCQQGL